MGSGADVVHRGSDETATLSTARKVRWKAHKRLAEKERERDGSNSYRTYAAEEICL